MIFPAYVAYKILGVKSTYSLDISVEMESILYLANLCKFSYKGYAHDGYDFSKAKSIEIGSSKMVIMKRGHTLLFSVTGTDSLQDWLLDADMTMVDLIVDAVKVGRVHRGFLTYIMKLWPIMYSEITAHEEFYGQYNTPDMTESDSTSISSDLIVQERMDSVDQEHSFRIKVGHHKVFKLQRFNASLVDSIQAKLPLVIFTGHSLGSCCAITALMASLKYSDKIRVRCITFASPRIGDKQWVNSYSTAVSRNFRVVHNHDIVTMLPIGNGYKHVNDEVRLGSNGKYLLKHRNLLWLLGKTTLCRLFRCCGSTVEERLIRDHLIDNYIDAIKEAINNATTFNTDRYALNAVLTVGSVDRHIR